MAGPALVLGASVALRGGDHRLGVVSPHHGGALDLGITLARSRTPVGIGRNRPLDLARGVQLYAKCAIGLLWQATRQTRKCVLSTKLWDRMKPGDNK
jgi:hypothetical protein